MRRIDKIKVKHKPKFQFSDGGNSLYTPRPEDIKRIQNSKNPQLEAQIIISEIKRNPIVRHTSSSIYTPSSEDLKKQKALESNARYAAEYDRKYSSPPKKESKSIKENIADLYDKGKTVINNSVNAANDLYDKGKTVVDNSIDAANNLYTKGRTFIDNSINATKIQEKQIAEKKPLISTDTIPLGLNHLYTIKDDHWKANKKKDKIWSFENAWDNNEGFNYQAIPILKNTPSNIKYYPGVQGVAQFILDSDIVSPEEKRNEHHPKPSSDNQWVLYSKQNSDNTTNVKYDLYGNRNKYKGYKNDFYIRSVPLSDIAFDDIKNRENTGYGISSTYLTTHDKKRVPILASTKTDDRYARFSGGSVVFAFKEPSTGKDIRVDFAGTVNEIQKYGELLQSKYKIDPKNVEVLMLDAGSYSAKPISINDTLYINQYDNFNVDRDGGGALLIPSSYNKRGGITTTVEFDNGGMIPPEYEAMSKVISQRNKHLNWVDRGLNPENYPVINNKDGSKSTHRLQYATGDNGEAYVYPTIIQQKDGTLKQLSSDEAADHAWDTKTAVQIPDQRLAEYYSKNGLIKHNNGGPAYTRSIVPYNKSIKFNDGGAVKNNMPHYTLPVTEVTPYSRLETLLSEKRKEYEKKYTLSEYRKSLPWGGTGTSLNNMHPNALRSYDHKINDMLFEDIKKEFPQLIQDFQNDRVGTLKKLGPDVVNILNNSSNASLTEANLLKSGAQGALNTLYKSRGQVNKINLFPKHLSQDESENKGILDIVRTTEIPVNFLTSGMDKNTSAVQALTGKPTNSPEGLKLVADPSNLITGGLPFLSRASKLSKAVKASNVGKSLKRSYQKGIESVAPDPSKFHIPIDRKFIERQTDELKGEFMTRDFLQANFETLSENIKKFTGESRPKMIGPGKDFPVRGDHSEGYHKLLVEEWIKGSEDRAKDYERINRTAEEMRKLGAPDAFEISEAFWGNVNSMYLPKEIHRGVKIPVTQSGLAKMPSKSIMDYSGLITEDVMTNNEGMILMNQYAKEHGLSRFQGNRGGENLSSSNYLHKGPFAATDKRHANMYGTINKKIVYDKNSKNGIKLVDRNGPKDEGDLPIGMTQTFERVGEDKRSFVLKGAWDAQIMRNLLSKKLGKNIEDISLKESEEFLRRNKISAYIDHGFGGQEIHPLPGVYTPTVSKYNKADGGFAITPYNKSMENKKKNKLVYPDLKTKFRNYIDNINQ